MDAITIQILRNKIASLVAALFVVAACSSTPESAPTGGSTGAYLWLIASVMAWTLAGYFVGAKRLEKADL